MHIERWPNVLLNRTFLKNVYIMIPLKYKHVCVINISQKRIVNDLSKYISDYL